MCMSEKLSTVGRRNGSICDATRGAYKVEIETLMFVLLLLLFLVFLILVLFVLVLLLLLLLRRRRSRRRWYHPIRLHARVILHSRIRCTVDTTMLRGAVRRCVVLR